VTSSRKAPVIARTVGQKNYVEAIERHDVVFAIGPAGTGKTYLAVAMAVAALK
jgi:phosphate starvation-inducible PhoH-like protein